MKRRALFFSSEPGGAATLSGAARSLRGSQWDVDIVGYGHGLNRFRRESLDCREVPRAGCDERLLRDSRADALVTSAGSLAIKGYDDTERRLWTHARSVGMPSVALLDTWQNYAGRFSGPGPEERLAFLPDRINALNEIGRAEMIAEGLPPERLVILGHPSISELPERAARADAAAVRKRLGLAADVRTLLFVSEPLREIFGAERGYDQYSVLARFLKDAPRVFPGAQVFVKLHPKDESTRFPADAKLVQDEATPLDCLVAADAVFGMTSVMLIEAFALGKPAASLQPGLRGEDALVLSRHGLIPRADSLTALGGMPSPGDRSRFPLLFDAAGFRALLDGLAAR